MSKVSRRTLALYAADQLMGGIGADELAKKLTAVMSEQAMSSEVDFLLTDIAWVLEQRGELSIGRVTAAHPLTKELRAALKDQIEKAVEVRQVLLEENVNKSVLGGIKIETATKVWDGTLARKLRDLREAF